MNYSPQAWDREARRFQRIADERRESEAARDMKRAYRRQCITDCGLALGILLLLNATAFVLYLLGIR